MLEKQARKKRVSWKNFITKQARSEQSPETLCMSFEWHAFLCHLKKRLGIASVRTHHVLLTHHVLFEPPSLNPNSFSDFCHTRCNLLVWKPQQQICKIPSSQPTTGSLVQQGDLIQVLSRFAAPIRNFLLLLHRLAFIQISLGEFLCRSHSIAEVV